MGAQVLTALAVERLRPRAARFEVRDARVAGLVLTVLPSGVRTWSVRYRHQGKGRRLVLGRYDADTFGLQAARAAAVVALRAAAAGDDPQGAKLLARRQAAAGVDPAALFATAWESFLSDTAKRRKLSTVSEYRRIGNAVVLPKLGKMTLADVTRADVRGLVDRLHARGVGTQANRTLAILRRFFNFAIGRDWLTVNPAKGLPKPHEEEARERVLTDDEIRLLWPACDRLGHPFGPLVKLLLLTAARLREVAGMRWSEVDSTARLWQLPASRTKNARPHAIYLADETLAILRSLPRIAGTDYVLTTNGRTAVSGFGKGKARLDSFMREAAGGDVPPFTLHDLRRTAATGMARLGIPIHVTESCLNHVSGTRGGLAGVYQRHDYAPEMEAAFRAWAEEVKRIVTHSRQ